MKTDIDRMITEKSVAAVSAISALKNGSRVFIGSGCGEPRHLVETMVRDSNVRDIMIYQVVINTLQKYLTVDSFLNRFSLKLFYSPNPTEVDGIIGKFDYIPAYLSEVPWLFASNQIGLDAALIQISPPDKFGFTSLGISVDVTREAVRQAKVVIAQVNPNLPQTFGDSFIHINDIDFLVPCSEEISEIDWEDKGGWVTRRIARFVSELIDDGSTIQVGYGYVPYGILQYFTEKNDLGIHTHMLNDSFLDLYENGNITNKYKNLFKDKTVTTLCQGTRRLYDYIDKNPSFYFGTADFVNNPLNIARNDNFISICSAVEVDLTGQICSDYIETNYFTGVGDQPNFIRGANQSKGGLSIIAMSSIEMETRKSRIVAQLSEGAGLVTGRADVNFVVTEYGVAQLKGKSIYQRVIELAQIAHPDYRQELIDQAKEYKYITNDQLPPRSEDLIFLESYKTAVRLRNGSLLSVRPLLPSDEIAYRNFFYSLEKETIYMRFFHNIDVFSHKMAQAHWAELDYRKSVTLIGMVRYMGSKKVVAIGTYAGMEDGDAEVALVVQEDYQGQGIGSILLAKLEEIAIENGGTGFTAAVLRDNDVMKHIFLKRYPNAVVKEGAIEVKIKMDFESPSASPSKQEKC